MIAAVLDALYVTPFGLAYLVALVAVAGLWRSALPALVLASSVFQGTAVLVLDVGQASYGVSPWHLATVAAGALLAARTVRDRGLRLSLPQGWALKWLAAYFVVALAGSVTLPHLFAGLPVFTPLSRWGFDVAPVPLQFGPSNVVQAITLCGHAVVLLFLLQALARDPTQRQRAPLGILIAVAAMLAILAYEWMAWVAGWPSSERVWINNPGYNLALSEVFLSARRIFAPFSEPSYGSAFLAAMLVGAFAVVLWGKRVVLAWAAVVVCGLALLGTVGATGWAAASVCFGAMLLAATVRAWRAGRWSVPAQRVRLAWCVLLLAAAVASIGVAATGRWPRVMAVAEQAVLGKATSESGQFRARSNQHALMLTRETMGLGVGLGSNRASSYLAALASNVGLAGALLLIAAVWSVLRARATEASDLSLAVRASLAGACVALAIGIPDLNIAFWWALLFAAILRLPRR